MAYTEKFAGHGLLGAPAAIDLTSAAVHSHSMIVGSKMFIDRIMLCVSTATVSTGNIVVAFKKRPTPGSAVGESTIGSLTIPTAIAAGKVYYKDISSANFEVGDQLVFEVTTAAAGGGAAGQAVPMFDGHEDPEVPANQSDMVASA